MNTKQIKITKEDKCLGCPLSKFDYSSAIHACYLLETKWDYNMDNLFKFCPLKSYKVVIMLEGE
jgi:hypothetical protein